MKTRILILILVGVVVISAVAATKLIAAKPDKPGKPDKEKPVHATNVRLVKKITMKGRPAWAGGGKPKDKRGAATGILGEPVDGDRYAVVVGISDYPGVGSDLDYCDDDAMEMAEALTDVYGFAHVTLLTDGAATRSAIMDAIDNIPVDAGEVVFFFSGHGASGYADDGDKEKLDEAIVAHDGAELLLPIWDGELRGAFSEFDTSRIILIFDTCLAGGMEKDLEEPGRLIAMAANERGYAYELDTLGNGEFSYYFVDEGTLQGKANVHDYDGDEIKEEPDQVTMEEAFDYAKANCTQDRPQIADSFENDLLP